MKKITITMVCIAALSLLCILPQAYAQDTGTGLFGDPSAGTQNVTPLFQPGESFATRLGLTWATGRIGSLLTDPPSEPNGTGLIPEDPNGTGLTPEYLIGMLDSWSSLNGILLGTSPSLARINALLSGPGEPPDESPAQPPDPPSNFLDASTIWNPFPVNGWNPLPVNGWNPLSISGGGVDSQDP